MDFYIVIPSIPDLPQELMLTAVVSFWTRLRSYAATAIVDNLDNLFNVLSGQ